VNCLSCKKINELEVDMETNLVNLDKRGFVLKGVVPKELKR